MWLYDFLITTSPETGRHAMLIWVEGKGRVYPSRNTDVRWHPSCLSTTDRSPAPDGIVILDTSRREGRSSDTFVKDLLFGKGLIEQDPKNTLK